jgi:hypothetical protein
MSGSCTVSCRNFSQAFSSPGELPPMDVMDAMGPFLGDHPEKCPWSILPLIYWLIYLLFICCYCYIKLLSLSPTYVPLITNTYCSKSTLHANYCHIPTPPESTINLLLDSSRLSLSVSPLFPQGLRHIGSRPHFILAARSSMMLSLIPWPLGSEIQGFWPSPKRWSRTEMRH